MSAILADFRWIGQHGIGRFAREVLSRLTGAQAIPAPGRPTDARDPLRLRRLLKRLRPDVFVSPGGNAPFRSPVPFVFTIHDLIHLHVAEESSLAKRAYYRFLIRPAAHKAFRVVTGSEHARGQICEWAGLSEDRVVVAGHGVSAGFTPEGPRHTPPYPYLFYVGNHKPHKNLPRLLEAFAGADIDGELRLVLTGQAEEPLARQVRQLSLDQRVVFAGDIPDEELPGYYRGASALLIPSLHEGFGLPAVEAMACGTPVVAANTTSLPEVVGNAALSVDPYDAAAISRAIQEIVGNQSLRRRLSAAGLERAAQFTWDKTAACVAQVLAEAIEAGS